jgi:hypothetical protein
VRALERAIAQDGGVVVVVAVVVEKGKVELRRRKTFLNRTWGWLVICDHRWPDGRQPARVNFVIFILD